MSTTTFDRLLDIRRARGAGYLLLIDPDNITPEHVPAFAAGAAEAGVDGFLVGGSLMLNDGFDRLIRALRASTNLPVIIFPGSLFQISDAAHAILFLVLISGRNADHLIGNQVLAAPMIRKRGLETISTGYMLIETGRTTSAEFMSNTKPIPHDKPDIAVAHAIAAETIGMKCLYLDAGSGAERPISDIMIHAIARSCSLPIIVGGGIRKPDEAASKVAAGASFIVTGTATENPSDTELIRRFADAIHGASSGR